MIKIRKATETDAPVLAQMLMVAIHKDPKEYPDIIKRFEQYVVTPGTLYFWERFDVAVDITNDGERVVGMELSYDAMDYRERADAMLALTLPDDGTPAETIQFDREWDYEAKPGEYYFDSIAVIPEYHGHGVGRMLQNHAVEKARASGKPWVAIVLPDNVRSIGLLQSNGFTYSEDFYFFGDLYHRYIKL